MRRWHSLKGNAKVELPSQFIFVDTETHIEQVTPTRQKQTLAFGYACFVRIRVEKGVEYETSEWLRFSQALDFWVWADAKTRDKSKTWVFAHNWNYDAGILHTANIPKQLGFIALDYVNDKPPFFLMLRKAKKTILLIDTINYFAGALSQIGKSIGIPKIQYPKRGASAAEWDEYCCNDVTIIKQAVLMFRSLIKEHDLGNFQRTLAGQAFTAYRHRFMSTPIMIHGDTDVCQLERDGYYGGRVECFYLGARKESLWYLDINSMYPAAMATQPFPCEYRGSFYGITMEILQQLLQSSMVVARVSLKTDKPFYPFRYKQRLVFPIGTFATTLCTPELQLALDHGHIQQVEWGARYKKAFLFANYVETLYTLRQRYTAEENPTFAFLCKILLNALYGKFGQNGKVWQTVGEWDKGDYITIVEQETPASIIRVFRQRLGLKQERVRHGETDNSFPAISAHVTAYGRVQLLQLIEQAGSGNVLYCDTDSLVVTTTGMERLRDQIHTSKLGMLKIEQVVDQAVFWGAKDYSLGAIEKHKGIKKNAKRLSGNEWEQDKFSSWDFHLSKGEDGFIHVDKVRKTLHRQYQKGIPTHSGWVSPFELPC